jgi:hypothetical protein
MGMASSNERKRRDVNHRDLTACWLDKASSCPQRRGAVDNLRVTVENPENFCDIKHIAHAPHIETNPCQINKMSDPYAIIYL